MRGPLAGFVQEMTDEAVKEGLTDEDTIARAVEQIGYGKPVEKLDTRILLKLMERVWNPVFWRRPGKPGRSYAGELLFFSNARSHQDDQKTFDAGRLVDTAMRLLIECGIDPPIDLEELHRATRSGLNSPSEAEDEGDGGEGATEIETLLRDTAAVIKGQLESLSDAVAQGNSSLAVLLERDGKKTSERGSDAPQEPCTDKQAGKIFRLLMELDVDTADDGAVADALDDQRFDGSHIKTWCQQRYTKAEAIKKIKDLNRKVANRDRS